MMKPDLTIDAVRKARHEISAAVDHDPRKLLEYYRKRQERYSEDQLRRLEEPCRRKSGTTPQTE